MTDSSDDQDAGQSQRQAGRTPPSNCDAGESQTSGHGRSASGDGGCEGVGRGHERSDEPASGDRVVSREEFDRALIEVLKHNREALTELAKL